MSPRKRVPRRPGTPEALVRTSCSRRSVVSRLRPCPSPCFLCPGHVHTGVSHGPLRQFLPTFFLSLTAGHVPSGIGPNRRNSISKVACTPASRCLIGRAQVPCTLRGGARPASRQLAAWVRRFGRGELEGRTRARLAALELAEHQSSPRRRGLCLPRQRWLGVLQAQERVPHSSRYIIFWSDFQGHLCWGGGGPFPPIFEEGWEEGPSRSDH